ncbi:AI-2E family transporter [Sulfobacillus thermosulfidooxidans]|uniref:AI-2E family transporter n=1 Tax=Sulfobacillus thermosulfidooxidans TaxID=28034 RepID=UPI000427203A|nr:AI-2E family transporter [Sulfobacillus thermosulfidooxidans]
MNMVPPLAPMKNSRLMRVKDSLMVVILAGIIIFAAERILSRLHEVVIVLVLSATIVIMLNPLVRLLSRRMGRGLAVLIVVLGSLVVFFGGIGGLSSIIVIQLQVLAKQLPSDVERLIPLVLTFLSNAGIHLNIQQIEHTALQHASAASSAAIHDTVRVLTSIVKGLVDTVLIIILTVYMLLDAPRIEASLEHLIPPGPLPAVLAVEQTVARVVGGYVRGQLLLSVLIGLAFGIGTSIIGLPDAVTVGVIAAVGELIPLLGPVIGSLLPLIFALLDHPSLHVPEVLIMLLGIHLLESDVLGPRIMRDQLGLHPIISIIALLIGATWLGIWGALFAVPAAGIAVAGIRAGAGAWRAYASSSPKDAL